MAEHVLKTIPVYWDAVKRGDKTFELRSNDRNFKVGDLITLERTEYPDQPLGATAYKITLRVTYCMVIAPNPYGLSGQLCHQGFFKPGVEIVLMGIEKLDTKPGLSMIYLTEKSCQQYLKVIRNPKTNWWQNLVLRLSHGIWSQAIGNLNHQLYERRIIDSSRLHLITALIDPTQDHKLYKKNLLAQRWATFKSRFKSAKWEDVSQLSIDRPWLVEAIADDIKIGRAGVWHYVSSGHLSEYRLNKIVKAGKPKSGVNF